MNPLEDTCHPANTEPDRVTTSDDTNNHDMLGLDRDMLRNDPENCPISTSSSSQDPSSLTAFFQSMVHHTQDIFHPQPTLAAAYHQLLQFPNEIPSQSEPFEQASISNFSNARPESPHNIFENGAFPVAQLPFEFIPLGVASSLTEASPADSMSRHESLFRLPAYYLDISPQNTSSEPRFSSHLDVACASRPQEIVATNSSAASVLVAPSQSSQDKACTLQQTTNPATSDGIRIEEMLPGGELDLALTSCALVDTPLPIERTLHVKKTPQQQHGPSASNKRSRSVALVPDDVSKLRHPSHPRAKPMGCGGSAKRTKPTTNTYDATLSGLPLEHSSKGNISKSKPKKKVHRQKLWTPSDQPRTPARPHVLASKKIERNILPPTPDSLRRPNDPCYSSRDGLDDTEKAEKKKRKIESIEKALEALDTLTDYLSKEANECSSICGDLPAENRTPMSSHSYNSTASLSLVSPQHFFTLGELGGRLRRRLDVERR
ncbi:hypothetical protein PCANC_02252 [Puccinia coronata f. sp. avenae]|uniref:Uncharacterized protein n=2 Tax=Puccinia coronata f. sp. avenae TaxID=200324 RepID=A0A2N5W0U0_9BASI|nr:hypothetical protein PCASD_20884 [Puccinia coronata f. sp. avenae]PLW55827.1 hypothetical protein PCANC_02252 [Puccinia coronata f. sp. avenae]